MKNPWINRANIRREEERIRQKYAAVNLFEEHLDLVKRVVSNGLGSLTKKERMIVRKGKPEPTVQQDTTGGLLAYCSALAIDEIHLVEDLKCVGAMLGYL